ncbi:MULTISPECIES: hypothetical protein [unclassified Streptomyces]|uniref:hypothetical protein n=1 Tax=unclassified Streptomyces TaxID=2593676 RepID=UPI000DAB9136|nr:MULTISPECIES: hypothetical protein [unclassified Streptomyces]PZT72450.1 hypothetical protein DNK55_28395 [Streptomyces sp. AC1-42T]PZT81231.1 hypothetical protein DNK56_03175 [Streptomyces sp. AC1-42W]
MGDVLWALSIPVLVGAGGLYAVGAAWWRRRHPAPPSPYTQQAARLAERAALAGAERIVDEAYGTLGALYDGQPGPARRTPARHVGAAS